MAKRTVKLVDLIALVNEKNRVTTSGRTKSWREGWNLMLENLLMQANAYAGFGYLEAGSVPKGELPGIIRGETLKENVFPDETRRIYYTHAKLTTSKKKATARS